MASDIPRNAYWYYGYFLESPLRDTSNKYAPYMFPGLNKKKSQPFYNLSDCAMLGFFTVPNYL